MPVQKYLAQVCEIMGAKFVITELTQKQLAIKITDLENKSLPGTHVFFRLYYCVLRNYLQKSLLNKVFNLLLKEIFTQLIV